MGNALWVVPCKFDSERPVIYECIEAIQQHHDKPNILVVDSGSADKSYFNFCFDRGVGVAAINNQLYGFGAHAWAQRHYPDVDFFYLIFDSLIVQANCDEYQNRPLTTMRHWSSRDHDWGWDGSGEHLSIWGRRELERMGVPFPAEYSGVFGPMMFAQRSVIEALDRVGYWFTQTTNGFLQCAQERVCGIVLDALGYDVTQSIQGPHTSHFATYDESVVRKVNLARA